MKPNMPTLLCDQWHQRLPPIRASHLDSFVSVIASMRSELDEQPLLHRPASHTGKSLSGGRLESDRPVGMMFPMNDSQPIDTPTRILDAVMSLIVEGGLPAVTQSGVCRCAGISKGGLVHHYPSKESMVDAFVKRAGEEYRRLVEITMRPHSAGSGRRATAYVDGFIGDSKTLDPSDCRDCAAVMVALVQGAGNGEMTALSRHLVGLLRADGLSLELAELIMVSVDGIWLQSVIEDKAESAARANRLQRQLKRMIRTEIKSKQKLITSSKS